MTTAASATYYEDAAVRLYLGDCVEILPTLDPVDHLITDPPYSSWVHAKVRRGGSVHAPDLTDGGPRRPVISTSTVLGFEALDAETRGAIAVHAARLARRWVLVFSDVESAHLWKADLGAVGLDYVRTGAWVKEGATPQFTGDRPASAFEAITICHPPGRKRWNGGGGHALWTYPIVHGRDRVHTTQKPEALIAELIADFTDPGDVILDPFAGSGTTLVAAKRLGRRAIGIERSATYYALAVARLSQSALDLWSPDPEGPTIRSLFPDNEAN